MKSTNYFFKRSLLVLTSFLFFTNTSSANEVPLRIGSWKGVLQLNDSTTLPFNFQIVAPMRFEITDGDEHIVSDKIVFDGTDSVFITLPLFDTEFRVKLTGDSIMTGIWINGARKNKNSIPFSAHQIETSLFTFLSPKLSKVKERYKVVFEPGTKSEYYSVGTFSSENGITKGTFATETGDYRYLEGPYQNDTFMVSTFDGLHALLFKAIKRNDSLLNGHFYSGISGHENWFASKDTHFELRNPDSLTYLKPGYSKIDFSFKNLEGKPVSLNDANYKNKVVIVQLMGTWCPNCMDETKFLASFYDTYKSKGVAVIGLAFERATDFDKAVSAVQRAKTRYNASYEFLITEKNGSTKSASEALPMLNSVMAFPTTIYIDKKGMVRKIYTGFYGPATGDAYIKYVDETTRFVKKLLAE